MIYCWIALDTRQPTTAAMDKATEWAQTFSCGSGWYIYIVYMYIYMPSISTSCNSGFSYGRRSYLPLWSISLVFSSSPDGICITCQLRGQLDGLRAELKGGGAMIETVRCVSKEGSEWSDTLSWTVFWRFWSLENSMLFSIWRHSYAFVEYWGIWVYCNSMDLW